jgi:hypothetical protein
MTRSATIAVVVPTYRRPEQLRRCLLGLERQHDRPTEVIVVMRNSDSDSGDVVRSFEHAFPGLQSATVNEVGVLAAMRRGVREARSGVIAFIDDDAVPPPDWISRIRAAFEPPDVGLVGGRDIVEGEDHADRPVVGLIGRWGRMIGNHHRGSGPPRFVDVLKGANMAVRREALALPLELRGSGAQVHWEVATSQWAAARGWRVLYDPAITVDHFPGIRHDVDQRDAAMGEAVFDAAFNYQLVLAGTRPALARRALFFGLLVGTTVSPGFARWCLAGVRREVMVSARFRPASRGRLAGHQAAKHGGLRMWEATHER